MKLFAGFDSDIVYALSNDDNVYVWGSGTTMLGVMKVDRKRLECVVDFEVEIDRNNEDDDIVYADDQGDDDELDPDDGEREEGLGLDASSEDSGSGVVAFVSNVS